MSAYLNLVMFKSLGDINYISVVGMGMGQYSFIERVHIPSHGIKLVGIGARIVNKQTEKV